MQKRVWGKEMQKKRQEKKAELMGTMFEFENYR